MQTINKKAPLLSSVSSSEETLDLNTSNNNSRDSTPGPTLSLVSKSNTSSEIWKYLGFAPDHAGNLSYIDVPRCKLYSDDVPAKWSNTSNLFYHRKKKHLNEYTKVKSKQKQLPRRPRNTE